MANEPGSLYNSGNLPILTDGQVTGNMSWPVDTQIAGGAAPQGAALNAFSASAGPFGIVAAAGATQGGATAIPSTIQRVMVTVTASTEGIILPTAATGRVRRVFVPGTVGVKIYPPLGASIDTGSANAPITLAAGKGIEFTASDTTHWKTSMKSA
jgi:hypothetical protein